MCEVTLHVGLQACLHLLLYSVYASSECSSETLWIYSIARVFTSHLYRAGNKQVFYIFDKKSGINNIARRLRAKIVLGYKHETFHTC